MDTDFTKLERRRVRELAALAWDRQLRSELAKIGDAITNMIEQQSSPHEVNDLIRDFHDGISRELFNRFSGNKPWFQVCHAHKDGVLTDDDIAGDSERIRNRINEFAANLRMTTELDT